MTVDELSAYYARLRQELNRTIFETEWVSHRAMNVEWSISGHFSETISTCIAEIREILAARKFGEKIFFDVLSTAPANDKLRSEFLRTWHSQSSVTDQSDLEALGELAVYCFTHILYTYEH